MTGTLSQYRTRVSVYQTTTGNWELALPPDPRRWHLYVCQVGAFGQLVQYGPDGIQSQSVGNSYFPSPFEVKFSDSPSLCTGAWYSNLTPFSVMLIVETLFVGG